MYREPSDALAGLVGRAPGAVVEQPAGETGGPSVVEDDGPADLTVDQEGVPDDAIFHR